jgi:threonyl-tRNA synthetase
MKKAAKEKQSSSRTCTSTNETKILFFLLEPYKFELLAEEKEKWRPLDSEK